MRPVGLILNTVKKEKDHTKQQQQQHKDMFSEEQGSILNSKWCFEYFCGCHFTKELVEIKPSNVCILCL